MVVRGITVFTEESSAQALEPHTTLVGGALGLAFFLRPRCTLLDFAKATFEQCVAEDDF